MQGPKDSFWMLVYPPIYSQILSQLLREIYINNPNSVNIWSCAITLSHGFTRIAHQPKFNILNIKCITHDSFSYLSISSNSENHLGFEIIFSTGFSISCVNFWSCISCSFKSCILIRNLQFSNYHVFLLRCTKCSIVHYTHFETSNITNIHFQYCYLTSKSK